MTMECNFAKMLSFYPTPTQDDRNQHPKLVFCPLQFVLKWKCVKFCRLVWENIQTESIIRLLCIEGRQGKRVGVVEIKCKGLDLDPVHTIHLPPLLK